MTKYFLVLSLLLVACGDDPTPTPVPPNNSQNNDMGEDTDVPDTNTNNETDIPIDPTDGCRTIEDIGTLTNGLMLEKKLIEPATGHETSCQTADVSSGSKIFSFTVAERTQATIIADAIPKMTGEIVIPPPPAIEIRSALCDPAKTEVLSCSNERQQIQTFEPNVPYFLVVNGDIDTEGVRLQFQTREVVCDESDNICVDGNKQVCVGGLRLDTFPCAGDCANETTCAGDTCDGVIELAASGTHRITGSRTAYSDTWDASMHPTCTFPEEEVPRVTDYTDVIVKLPAVPQGAEIKVSAENDVNEGSYMFFFSDTCEADSCIFADDIDDFGFNETTYTTTSAGDVYIRIESLGAAERIFAIDIEIN